MAYLTLDPLANPSFLPAALISTLSPESLRRSLEALNSENYASTRRYLLEAIQPMEDGSKADLYPVLLQLRQSLSASSEGLTSWQQKLLFELALSVAGPWAARKGLEDITPIENARQALENARKKDKHSQELPRLRKELEKAKAAFRVKNGPYDRSYNDCHHYPLSLYYAALSPFMSKSALSKMSKKKEKNGRPRNFDYAGSSKVASPQVSCFSESVWRAKSTAQKDDFLSGDHLVFVSYSVSSRDIEKLTNFLLPGDLVSVAVNPHRKRNEAPTSHVGLYLGDGMVADIHDPLSGGSLEFFVSRVSSVTVRRPVNRLMPDLYAGLSPLLQELPESWKLPIQAGDNYASTLEELPLSNGKK